MVNKKGLFVTVEGGEGVGKSTFLKNLLGLLQNHTPPIPLLSTREPGGTPFAEAIRGLFLMENNDEQWTLFSELCLLSAARNQHITKLIAPHLAKGGLVLCDRFIDSTRVYQGFIKEGFPSPNHNPLIETFLKESCQGIFPHITFILDAPLETSLERLNKRKQESNEIATRFDEQKRAFHQKVKEGFLLIAKEEPKRCIILDATLDSPSMALLAFQHIIKALNP